MKTLKELIKKDNHIWFYVEKEDKKEFLKFAKRNGCTWINGEEINIKEDKCTHFMGINKDLKLGFIAIQCWINKGKNQARKIVFKDILGEGYEQNCN